MKTNDKIHVVVLGASNKPERYSFQALRRLKDAGYVTTPVHPAIPEIDSTPCVRNFSEIMETVDVATLYISPKHQNSLLESLLKNPPNVVLFNPGTENPSLEKKLEEAGIKTIRACTLVLLSTQQFNGVLPL